MQEQRQPPHSPAHPPYPGYPPPRGDHQPKPDPDEPLPQMRRPLSTGNAHDSMTPGTPHSAHPPPPPPHSHSYPDDKRHLSFDGGPPPHMYRQPSYPPPTPLPHQSSYDYPPSYGTPHGDNLYPIHISSAAGKRKAQRASQVGLGSAVIESRC